MNNCKPHFASHCIIPLGLKTGYGYWTLEVVSNNFFVKDFIYLFYKRGERREKER